MPILTDEQREYLRQLYDAVLKEKED